MLPRQALPFRPFFFLGLKHILPAIPAITVTIIYASHRSKHVLPVFCFVVTYYTSCSITCSFPAIPFFRYPHCNVFSFSLLFSPYIYKALRMYCILENHDVYTSALSAVAAAIAWASIYITTSLSPWN